MAGVGSAGCSTTIGVGAFGWCCRVMPGGSWTCSLAAKLLPLLPLLEGVDVGVGGGVGWVF